MVILLFAQPLYRSYHRNGKRQYGGCRVW